MADINSQLVETERRKREFYSQLEQYYRRKWNATLRIPYISGVPVDLYLLYQKVTSLGGWSKVSSGNRWPDVVDCLNIPSGCVASEQVVKSIYMRYLAKYEQIQLFGETDGDNADGSGSNLNGRSQRGRLYLSSLSGQPGASPSARYASSSQLDQFSSNVPMQQNSNILERPQCERLIRSLKSGLPNEVDFAINVCTILSNPAKSGNIQATLRLNSTPFMIDLLLAHAGIFDSGALSYRQLYKEGWKSNEPSGKFERFWRHYIDTDDELVKMLLDKAGNGNIGEAETSSIDATLFCCLSLSTSELATMTKRVEQIGSILRNFSFEAECQAALANNRTMIRYLIIAMNSSLAELKSLALDTLSNVASEANLDVFDASLLQLLMKTLSRCLHSEDKLHVIRTLETIGNLCRNERNEAILCDYLEPSVIRRLIALLAVKDIMTCVYLLECLYQMTEMGRVPCQRIAEEPRAVDTLVQLVTVEAVSFGPNGLLGMKVVEYGMPTPHTAILPHPLKTIPPQPASLSALVPAPHHLPAPTAVPAKPSLPTTGPSGTSSPAQQPPPPFLARPVRPVAAGDVLLPSGVSTRLSSPVSAGLVQEQPLCTSPAKEQHSTGKLMGRDSPAISTPPAASMASAKSPRASTRSRGPTVTVHQDQHVEQLTMNWLRQNCSTEPDSRVSRGELYTSYVQDMRGLYDSMAVSVSVFTNYVRQMFPSCSVRQLENAVVNGGASVQTANCRSTLLEFDGLKFTHRNAVKNNLLSPQSSCSSTSPPMSQLVAQHPLVQQILTAGGPPEKQPSGGGGAPPIGSPISTRTVGDGANASANAIRARSDSAGTLDSAYSVPGTPDSLSSGFSGTNSSTGMYGATSFIAAQQLQNSPKTSKAANKTTKSQPGGPSGSSTAGHSDSGLPNGSVSKEELSGGSVTASAACHLEVCHPAQEARAVIETGDSHEAKIIRVANTIAMVSSQFYVPSADSTSAAAASTSAGKTANGGSESCLHSDNSNGCDRTSTPTSSPEKAVPSASITTNTDSPSKKKPKRKLSADNATVPLNGLVKQPAALERSSSSMVSGDSSPGPDTETIKQNVTQSIQSIQELLAGGSSDGVKVEKDGSVEETTTNQTAKKGGPGRKRKTYSTDDGLKPAEDADEKPTPTPKKKKYYPKKKKTADIASAVSPQKRNEDALSQASTSSPVSTSTSAVTSASSASSFRLPLPPSANQTPYVVQQAVITAASGSAGAPGAQVIVRIPPPSASQLKYVCEWDSCGKSFTSSNAVYYHICKDHITDETRSCAWPRCDQMPRLRWSLVAHIQEVHCSEHVLRSAAIRRYELSTCGFTNVPEARAPPAHPGYPPDAAIVAIKRHALVNLQKEVVDENEGPVTKSIRLTSSLILRNIARYSVDGRRVLRKYEHWLVYLAHSRLESSAALAQCLNELNCTSPV